MRIVGIEQDDHEADHVHTIDLWYSRKRNVWVVERLTRDGHLVGAAHHCPDEHDAEACLQDWLRAHAETHLAAHKGDKAKDKPVRKAA